MIKPTDPTDKKGLAKWICACLRNKGLKAGIVPSRQSKLTEKYDVYIPVHDKQKSPLHVYYKPDNSIRRALHYIFHNHEIKHTGGDDNTKSFEITS